MEKKTMGSFLSALRKANGMTQQDVADRLGVTNRAVSRWERDEALPDITLIPALAEMFGVTCDELLKGEKTGESEDGNKQKDNSKVEKQRKVLVNNSLLEFRKKIILSLCIAYTGAALLIVINNIGYTCYEYYYKKIDPIFGVMACFIVFLFALYMGFAAISKINYLIRNNDLEELENKTFLSEVFLAKRRGLRVIIAMIPSILLFMRESWAAFKYQYDEVVILYLVLCLVVELVVYGMGELIPCLKTKINNRIRITIIWQDAIQWLIIVFICLYPVLDMSLENYYLAPSDGKMYFVIIWSVCLVISTLIGFLFVKFSKTYKKKVKFITIRNMILTAVGIGWVYSLDLNWEYNGKQGWLCYPGMSVLSWILIPVIIASVVVSTIMWNKKHSWEM